MDGGPTPEEPSQALQKTRTRNQAICSYCRDQKIKVGIRNKLLEHLESLIIKLLTDPPIRRSVSQKSVPGPKRSTKNAMLVSRVINVALVTIGKGATPESRATMKMRRRATIPGGGSNQLDVSRRTEDETAR